MSSTDYSSANTTRGMCSRDGGGLCGGGHWSWANIAAMVLGFLVFPPLGIVLLVWTLMGRPVQALPAWLREKWNQVSGKTRSVGSGESENSVFDEFQQTQYDRIREIKDEIGRRAEAFRAFRNDSKRRQDQKEFDEFMATNPGNDSGAQR